MVSSFNIMFTGGKSLAILQNCLPNKLVCNDNQRSRLIRVRQVMHAYLQTDLDGGTDFSNGVVQVYFWTTKLITKGHYKLLAFWLHITDVNPMKYFGALLKLDNPIVHERKDINVEIGKQF